MGKNSMAMGIVSESDFLKELEKCDKPLLRESNQPKKAGREKGEINVPESFRKIIGETSIIDGRTDAVELAKEFGISKSSVSAYKNGSTSTATYNKTNKSILEHINNSRQKVIKKAGKRLNYALDAITPDKLDEMKVKDLASVAKDMSVIIRNMEPPRESNEGESNQYVIFAPTFRDERTFETITVPE
jgi:hypothetical protein